MTLRNSKAALLTLAIVITAGCARSDFVLSRQDQVKWRPVRKADIANAKEAELPRVLPDTYFAAGMLHEKQGSIGRAIQQYRRAIAVNHKHVRAYHRLGMLLGAVGQHEEARKMLERAVALQPDSAVLRNNYGFELMLQEQWVQAQQQLERAIEISPHFARAHINLGMVRSRLGRFDDALASFKVVLPEADAYYNLGLMYRGQKRYEEAAEAFRETLRINPKFTAAEEQLDGLAEKLPSTPVTKEPANSNAEAVVDRTALEPDGRETELAVDVADPSTISSSAWASEGTAPEEEFELASVGTFFDIDAEAIPMASDATAPPYASVATDVEPPSPAKSTPERLAVVPVAAEPAVVETPAVADVAVLDGTKRGVFGDSHGAAQAVDADLIDREGTITPIRGELADRLAFDDPALVREVLSELIAETYAQAKAPAERVIAPSPDVPATTEVAVGAMGIPSRGADQQPTHASAPHSGIVLDATMTARVAVNNPMALAEERTSTIAPCVSNVAEGTAVEGQTQGRPYLVNEVVAPQQEYVDVGAVDDPAYGDNEDPCDDGMDDVAPAARSTFAEAIDNVIADAEPAECWADSTPTTAICVDALARLAQLEASLRRVRQETVCWEQVLAEPSIDEIAFPTVVENFPDLDFGLRPPEVVERPEFIPVVGPELPTHVMDAVMMESRVLWMDDIFTIVPTDRPVLSEEVIPCEPESEPVGRAISPADRSMRSGGVEAPSAQEMRSVTQVVDSRPCLVREVHAQSVDPQRSNGTSSGMHYATKLERKVRRGVPGDRRPRRLARRVMGNTVSREADRAPAWPAQFGDLDAMLEIIQNEIACVKANAYEPDAVHDNVIESMHPGDMPAVDEPVPCGGPSTVNGPPALSFDERSDTSRILSNGTSSARRGCNTSVKPELMTGTVLESHRTVERR